MDFAGQLWGHMIGRAVLDKEYVQCMNVLRVTISESASFLYKSTNTYFYVDSDGVSECDVVLLIPPLRMKAPLLRENCSEEE